MVIPNSVITNLLTDKKHLVQINETWYGDEMRYCSRVRV